MRAHQNDEKQEGRDDSREEIDGMVALRQTAKKARDRDVIGNECVSFVDQGSRRDQYDYPDDSLRERLAHPERLSVVSAGWQRGGWLRRCRRLDRKSTRLNSSHEWISYAVFCLKKKQ